MKEMKHELMLPLVGGVLIEFAFGRENDNSHVGITQDRDFVCLLEETTASLGEGNLTIDLVLYPPQLHSSPSHGGFGLVCEV